MEEVVADNIISTVPAWRRFAPALLIAGAIALALGGVAAGCLTGFVLENQILIVAGALWRYDRRLGLLGVAYALGMGFSLVYLGEHYLVDVLAGWALAAGIITLLEVFPMYRGRER